MNKYSILCFFLFVLAVLLFRKKKEMIPRKYLCFLSLVPLLSMLVVNGLLKGRGVAWNLSLLAILVLNVLVYYLMHLLDDYSVRRAREETLREQSEMQKENYEKLSRSFKQGNRLLHDVNKHLRQIGQYLNEKEWAEASRYAAHMEESLQGVRMEIDEIPDNGANPSVGQHRRKRKGNIFVVFRILAFLLVFGISLLTLSHEYKYYRVVKEFEGEKGFVFSSSTGYYGSNPTDLTKGLKKVKSITTWGCSGFMRTGSEDYLSSVSYPASVRDAFTPKLAEGSWLDAWDYDVDDPLEVVISANPYGWRSGSEIALTYYDEDGKSHQMKARVTGVLKEGTELIGYDIGQGGILQKNYHDLYSVYRYEQEKVVLVITALEQMKAKNIPCTFMAEHIVTYEPDIKQSEILSNERVLAKNTNGAQDTAIMVDLEEFMANSRHERDRNLLTYLPVLICVLLLTLLSFSLIHILSILIVYGLINGDGLVWQLSLPAIPVLNVLVYYLVYLRADYSARQVREEMLQKQIGIQRENYEKLSQSFQWGNQLLQDVNKHVRQIDDYLEEENWEAASRYVEQMEGSIQKNYHIVNCGNLVMDSILSNLKYQLESQGSVFILELHIDTTRIQVTDYDLVTILGNVADNVIEGVRYLEHAEVYARLETTEDELLIHIKNPTDGEKKRRKKKDHWFHGLGLQNVREVVEKYGGISSFEEKQGCFETMIMIPYKE